MNFNIEPRSVPEKRNFLYMSQYEKQNEKIPGKFPVRAIEWDREFYPIEMLNGIVEGETRLFSVCSPESPNELIEALVYAFHLQKGDGEQDLVRLMESVSRFFENPYDYIQKLSEEIGKHFERNRDFYLWSNTLDSETKNLFLDKNISIRILFRLKDEDEKFKKELVNILLNFNPSSNTLRNVVDYSREIVLRENISFHELFEKLEMRQILETDYTPKDKFNLFMERLYLLRFPIWSAKRAAIKREADSFRAKTGVEIVPPDFAEGSSVEMRINISSVEEVYDIFSKIKKEEQILKDILGEIKE